MGISTPIDDTPAMVLGSSAVKVLDMAVAYTAVANGGYAAWPYSITEIYTREGYPLYTRLYDEDERQRILDEDTVEAMTEMMEKVILEGTGKRAQLPFFAARQNRHFAGLPRRLVRRLYRPLRGSGMGRQRRQLADERRRRRHPAGRNLEKSDAGGGKRGVTFFCKKI